MFSSQRFHETLFLLGKPYTKHRENRKTLPWEHLIGCQMCQVVLTKSTKKVLKKYWKNTEKEPRKYWESIEKVLRKYQQKNTEKITESTKKYWKDT